MPLLRLELAEQLLFKQKQIQLMNRQIWTCLLILGLQLLLAYGIEVPLACYRNEPKLSNCTGFKESKNNYWYCLLMGNYRNWLSWRRTGRSTAFYYWEGQWRDDYFKGNLHSSYNSLEGLKKGMEETRKKEPTPTVKVTPTRSKAEGIELYALSPGGRRNWLKGSSHAWKALLSLRRHWITWTKKWISNRFPLGRENKCH